MTDSSSTPVPAPELSDDQLEDVAGGGIIETIAGAVLDAIKDALPDGSPTV